MDIGRVWENAFFHLKDWTPCQTQRSTIVLFWGIHFLWPIFIKFQGEPWAKKGNFLIKIFQKGPKNAFCGLFVLNFKPVAETGSYSVFLVLWESSQNP